MCLLCVTATLSEESSEIHATSSPPASSSPHGSVTNVGISIADGDRIPGSTGKAVTVQFTTATPLMAGQTVTVTLPHGYISGTIGAIGAKFASTTTGTHPQYIVTATAEIAPGAHTVILSGATIGGPMVANPMGVSVSTSTDLVSQFATTLLIVQALCPEYYLELEVLLKILA